MHDSNKQTGLDLAAARRGSTIDVEAVRSFLYDGNWELHHGVVGMLSSDSVFDKSQRAFMSRTERYKRALAMSNRVYELKKIHNWSSFQCNLAIHYLDEPTPVNLHTIAFEPVFLSQASDILLSTYAKLISTRGILGCYLQTELGHGSNVSALETTATYLPKTNEFEIHSPSLTSAKWWIGALGKTATHGVVQARLLLDGKDFGPHLFFVQLRSLDDHKVLPGITIGDIGPKALGGFTPTDNGFAIFDHIRIPREHMLSKFAQVTEDGRYVQPPHAKLSYGGMLYIRSSMVTSGGWVIAKAATISIRYTTVRRQGNKGSDDGLERQVITYPSTYYRLLPILSHAYVFIQLGRSLTKAFTQMSTLLSKGDTSLLAEMHALTSGLKILVTTTCVADLETARRSMGGHGYSEWAGVGRMYADYLPSATYEGDNFVLDQQVVRAALKSYRSLLTSSPSFPSLPTPSPTQLPPSSHYLHLLLPPSTPPSSSSHDWNNPETAILLLEWRAALLVKELVNHKNGDEEEHLDASMNQRVSKAVTEAFVGRQVGEMIQNMRFDVVKDLFRLYLLTTVEAALVDLLSFNLLSSSSMGDPTRNLRMTIKSLCISLLPNAVGLSDAFGFTDWELDSALGVHDGKVYEALWKRGQAEPLNRTEVPDGYEEFVKPMLVRGHRLAGAKL